MPRLMLYLEDTEFQALKKVAESELRYIKDQIRFMLRESLIERNVLPPATITTTQTQPRKESR